MDGRSFFMNMRFPAVLVVGFVAGLTGGVASHYLTPEKRSELRPGPIRGTRFELVDEAGKTRAIIYFAKPRSVTPVVNTART